MACDSLIRHLQKDRVKRPRSTTKASRTAIKESVTKPSAEPAEEAKRQAQEDLVKRNMELAKETEPAEEAPKTLPGFDPARMDKTIER